MRQLRPNSYREDAVVLRHHKIGEADYVVTLLTRERGIVRAVANGVRRPRSKFGGRLELFAHVEVYLQPGRSIDTITQVRSLSVLPGELSDDYSIYTTACAIAETAERLAGEEHAPAPELFVLTVGALRSVAAGRRDRELLFISYLVRGMGAAGWMPALTQCARCDAAGPHRAFHVAAGGAVCVQCRPAGSATPSPGVLDLLAALAAGDWEFAELSSSSARSQARGLAVAHLQWHLERQLRSLPMIERHAPHTAGVHQNGEPGAWSAAQTAAG